MELCSNNHGEVAYVSDRFAGCPACEYAEEIAKDYLDDIDELENQVEVLQDDLANLQDELDNARE